MENDVAPTDCAYLLACRQEKFADKVWKQLLEEEDLTDAQYLRLANAIVTIDGNLYKKGKKSRLDRETAREFKKDEAWHQKNIKWAKAFMRRGIEAMEDYSDSTSFDLADAEKTLKILKDPELNRQYKEARKKDL